MKNKQQSKEGNKMKSIIALLMVISVNAYAASAYHTGQQRNITTVTYKQGIECQYSYNGRTFWKIFVGQYSCPYNITVY